MEPSIQPTEPQPPPIPSQPVLPQQPNIPPVSDPIPEQSPLSQSAVSATTLPTAPVLSVPTGPLSVSFKYVKNSANVGIILGVILTAISLVFFLFVDMGYILNLPFAIAILILGLMLKRASQLSKALTVIKTLYIIVIVLIVLAFVTSGRGVGLLTILLVYYLNKALAELYDAGLTTSKIPAKAKAKI